ncbi:MAG: methionine--tRNA ligase subunit beta, partial [Ignavibacteriaceae bacterium]|nr:methionine--tRNA ligase subunit beta [Ignavibacteriaceae bacterium]
MNLARTANKYFNDSEPWKSVKTNREKCSTSLNISLQTIYTLAELFSPIIPFSSEKIFKMLNSNFVGWNESGKENLREGHKLNIPEILFVKIEDSVIEEKMKNLGSTSELTAKEKEVLPQITYEDFMKTQLCVAKIIEAEKVNKSEKLLKLKVDLGDEQRQIIAGIAKAFSPEEIIGKKVIVVANLKPAKLMGLESQGMILAVENESGSLNLLEVDNKISLGTRAK